MQTYAYIPAILGICLYLLFMLVFETVSFMNPGIIFVLHYSGVLKAHCSISQIADSLNLLRSVRETL